MREFFFTNPLAGEPGKALRRSDGQRLGSLIIRVS